MASASSTHGVNGTSGLLPAADYTVPASTLDAAAKTVSGTDTVTVEAGGKLSVTRGAAIN